MILHSLHLLLVVLRHRAVHLLPQALNHQEAHLPEKVHLRQLLIIQTIHLQISPRLKVAVVVNPKQVKLKQLVITTVKRDLVSVVL
jgi:hypothetical protein